ACDTVSSTVTVVRWCTDRHLGRHIAIPTCRHRHDNRPYCHYCHFFAMDVRKCCVGNCSSTNRTHRLFLLPKDDNLRELWLSFLIPTNIELTGLSKHQLLTKRVCQNHFDRYQFDSMGNRLRHGYPCLFSDKEISFGIPLSSTGVGDHLSDHNYFLSAAPESHTVRGSYIEVDDDHNYHLPILPKSVIDEAAVQGHCSRDPEPIETELMAPSSDQILQTPGFANTKAKNVLTSSCFVKKMKKQALSVKNKSFNDRLAGAKTLSQDSSFQRSFSMMNKHAQNFIMMQIKSVGKKQKGVRFTNDEKLLALTLMKESPKGYRLLQKIFKLPSKRTLNRLAEMITFGVGINNNIFQLIERRALNWDIKKKLCSIVFDEVAILGLVPIALVCDQGTTFRSALKGLREDTEQRRNVKGEHNDGTIEVSGQRLSVIFDPPHLLKGLRNNFLNKNLIFNNSIATWDDILTVYRADCQLGHTRMNKKLTDHHVISAKIKKMKVSVAAQVLSEQTSAMLKYTALFDTTVGGEKVSATMKTTGDAVEFMDKLFDSVNGTKRNTKKGKLRGPVKPNSKHFEFWREATSTIKNIRFVDSASKRAKNNKKEYLVRVPSLDGWVMTLKSFERIANLLFTKYHLKYFYPGLINQDPLENFFGRIRAINYRNVNPDCYTFVNAFKSLLISNVMGPHSIYSNCEDDDGKNLIDFYNLLKSSEEENKENVPCTKNVVRNTPGEHEKTVEKSQETLRVTAVNERVRVHSSAYTAGYICRKINKKMNCQECQKTLVAEAQENFHKWIMHREYKQLKNSNLAYPSKQFLILYRDIANLIHSYLIQYAHLKSTGKNIKKEINKNLKFDWLGCSKHKKITSEYLISLILRLQIHNWCNIINKILRGDVEEKHILKMKCSGSNHYDDDSSPASSSCQGALNRLDLRMKNIELDHTAEFSFVDDDKRNDDEVFGTEEHHTANIDFFIWLDDKVAPFHLFINKETKRTRKRKFSFKKSQTQMEKSQKGVKTSQTQNWRGEADTDSLTKIKVTFVINGNLCDVVSTGENSIKVDLRNTCCFDSVIYLLSMTFNQSRRFQEILNTYSEDLISQYIKLLSDSASTVGDTHKMRTQIGVLAAALVPTTVMYNLWHFTAGNQVIGHVCFCHCKVNFLEDGRKLVLDKVLNAGWEVHPTHLRVWTFPLSEAVLIILASYTAIVALLI
ncbi:hypothetical protein HW555_011915, partial [Spodoptera exigua]